MSADRVDSSRWQARPWTLDLLVTLAISVGAFAARFPYVYSAPRFHDDTFNALHSLKIYRGEQFPLTDVEAYIGAFFNYAVAAGMFVIGPTIYAARLVVMWFGVVTVTATYFLGRELGGRTDGRLVGVIAAVLMMTNGIHIAPVGHVAFSGSITPLFTTLAFWLLHRWGVRRTDGTLVWAGFMLGMSMQTHPTIVAFLPGAAAWVAWERPSVLRTRWPYLATLAFLVAFSPMIVYNVMTGGQSIRHAEYTATERPDYARSRSTELTAASYLSRQSDYWLMLHGTLGGAVDERPVPRGYLTDPFLLVMSGLGIAGLAWAAMRHRYRLPLWLGGSFALILPIFNATHYDVEYDGRYVIPLLPMIYAAIGLLLVDGGRAARRRFRSVGSDVALSVGIGAVVVVLAAMPLVSLGRYYLRASKAEPTNESMVQTMNEVKAALGPTDIVLLDNNLNDRRTEYASPWDEASVYRVLRYIMEFDQIPYEVMDVDDAALDGLAQRKQPSVVILSAGSSSKDTATLGQLIEKYGMTRLDGKPARPPRVSDRFGLYRFNPPRPAAQVLSRP
ncbi:MAG: glycosyltransferase family 39 protein [Chloroflexota bacterium]